ncbi:MAG: GguC family protein [bacterium]|nr:GguC family protein [bacterium]
MIRLIQIVHPDQGRGIATVDGDRCRLLEKHKTIYDLAQAALASGHGLAAEAGDHVSDTVLDYGAIYEGTGFWQLLPSFDHPEEPTRCLVSGTGLTHMASAKNRDSMHEKGGEEEAEMTDSMKMFQWGLEGGRPEHGSIGVQPEWFYKGTGLIVKGSGEPLDVPSYADDGGEEPEIAGVYVMDGDGKPWRVGFTMGNEFADHVMEAKNYLYLAPSKLRNCAIGPELIADGSFEDVSGTVSIERNGEVVWSRKILTGEDNMSYSLANLEHHHFKYAAHRRPGDAHIHFYGADGFSFGEGFSLQDGDVMVVSWKGFGRPLRNPIRISTETDRFVAVNRI